MSSSFSSDISPPASLSTNQTKKITKRSKKGLKLISWVWEWGEYQELPDQSGRIYICTNKLPNGKDCDAKITTKCPTRNIINHLAVIHQIFKKKPVPERPTNQSEAFTTMTKEWQNYLDQDEFEDAFDKLQIEDDEEDDEPKVKRIKINNPVNTSGLIDVIKDKLYHAINIYYEDLELDGLVASLLDLHWKNLSFITKAKKGETINELHRLY
ncbi:12925_t:CDS:2 [Racocetra fulgida]|uniref:12925_t:CDS:1 n=1 Tax=Racocetra fulgida TaxID=60492 RepID=A0A9N9FHS1_9GLOM|nr:12925_t:CDS:2 [Racocetra fulgida]